jgi:hypothetical protein
MFALYGFYYTSLLLYAQYNDRSIQYLLYSVFRLLNLYEFLLVSGANTIRTIRSHNTQNLKPKP